MFFKRAVQHLINTSWATRSMFPIAQLKALENRISESETEHHGEVRFVIESSLDWKLALKGMPARERALEWFGNLRVWDTEYNTGVLIYILVADHDIEIIADRGIAQKVDHAAWQSICKTMQHAFHKKLYIEGLHEAMNDIHRLLKHHFPSNGKNFPNQLSNEVIVR